MWIFIIRSRTKHKHYDSNGDRNSDMSYWLYSSRRLQRYCRSKRIYVVGNNELISFKASGDFTIASTTYTPIDYYLSLYYTGNSVTTISLLAIQHLTRILSTWDMSNVGIIQNMFDGATSFNQDIGNWDVSNVINMSEMFKGASAFNNGGSNSINNWNVSNVTNMFGMFNGVSVFNQDIGRWDVSKVTVMQAMFGTTWRIYWWCFCFQSRYRGLGCWQSYKF